MCLLEGGFPATMLLLFSGPLAVPDAAAQGHGDPGWGADAEGAAGHRWWHPGCPGAHFCWRPRTLRPHIPQQRALWRGEHKKTLPLLQWQFIHSFISHLISVLFYKVNKIFVHIYVFLLLNKCENDGFLIFERCLWPRLSKETNCVFTLRN